MSEPDLLLQRLRELPLEAPPGALSKQLTAAAHARLVPRKVHPAWSVAVAASVLVYLGWALAYACHLY
ncbi:MAG: hypothetical protein SFV15_04530 [Polyangiaceae bacterium]|nr:hypothetical protein [Polyangiaceae bacterium]